MKTFNYKALASIVVLNFSTPSYGVPVQFGSLSYNSAGSNIIYDTLNGREYLSLDTLSHLNYADTESITGIGGEYETWSIAMHTDAQLFIDALLEPAPASCHTNSDENTSCGNVIGWYDGAFGGNHTVENDYIWYMAKPGFIPEVGSFQLFQSGSVTNDSAAFSIPLSDIYSDGGGSSDRAITWLVYRESPTPVPAPSIISVLGIGLIGGGIAKRKKLLRKALKPVPHSIA